MGRLREVIGDTIPELVKNCTVVKDQRFQVTDILCEVRIKFRKCVHGRSCPVLHKDSATVLEISELVARQSFPECVQFVVRYEQDVCVLSIGKRKNVVH